MDCKTRARQRLESAGAALGALLSAHSTREASVRMVKSILRMAVAASVVAVAVPAVAVVSAGPVVLYDAALNNLPQAQG